MDDGGLVPTLVSSGLAAAASMLGVALVSWSPVFTRRSALPIAAFAAGVILGASFLHLLPEAIERTGSEATAWALAAFFFLYILETHAVRHEHHGDHEHGDAHSAAARHAAVPAEAHAAHAHAHANDHAHAHAHADSGVAPGVAPFAFVAALAFALHSAFDGLALGIGFAPKLALGASAAIAVLSHKVPEGIALAALLLRGNLAPARAAAIAGGIALLTPVAALLAHALLEDAISPVMLGRLLALVAGSFVYIASADLLPEVTHHPRISRTLLMLGGVGVAVAVRMFGEH